MKTRAAVAFEAGKPLEICEVDLDGPREGEVLVEIKATGICHTDEFTLSGADPEGIFPAILRRKMKRKCSAFWSWQTWTLIGKAYGTFEWDLLEMFSHMRCFEMFSHIQIGLLTGT